MATKNKKIPSTGDQKLDVKILLADHAQSREEARYRDRLFYELLSVMVILIGVLINALISVDSHLIRLFIFITAFALFFILSTATWSIKNSRDAAWKHSGKIEKDSRLAGLLETGESIVSAGKKGNWFVRRHAGTLISAFATAVLILSGIGILFSLFCVIGCD